MKSSNFLSINLADVGKGFIMAFLMVTLGGLYTSLTSSPPHFPTGSEWITLATAGLGAGIAYILKNVFTNSDGQLLKKEQPKE